MRQNFDACLALTLRYEGGYVDHAADPGGATNMGITRATLARARGHAVSKSDVRRLTMAEAGEIYRKKYWAGIKGDDLPKGVDAVLFDHAVNSGEKAAIRALQKVLVLRQDGVFGKRTLESVVASDPAALVRALCAARMESLRKLSTWLAFGRGWKARVEALERAALVMCDQQLAKGISTRAEDSK